MVEAGFKSDNHMLMFPAGCAPVRSMGEIHDLPWKKTFITKSVETHRDVVPIHFSGRNSERFYRIANLCKTLRLKVNIAMLFLVDEMYKNVHKTFHVTIGNPFPGRLSTNRRHPPSGLNTCRTKFTNYRNTSKTHISWNKSSPRRQRTAQKRTDARQASAHDQQEQQPDLCRRLSTTLPMW